MSNEIAVRENAELSVTELKNQVALIQQTMSAVMKEGEHYGVIPGTSGKPTLLKAGAEKLALVFRLAPSFDVRRTDLPGNHREFEIICTLTHIPSGRVLGQGVGSCSTMESRYRYRHAEGENTGKQVPKDYWKARNQDLIGGKGFVPKKVDGNWFIFKQSDQKIENPDIADVYNTVLKIAKKRAQVDATLTATAASDFFTQDMEDFREPEPQKQAEKQPDQTPQEDPRPKTALKTERAALGAELLAYCNNDKTRAEDTLFELTGKRTFNTVTNDEAKKAREALKTLIQYPPQSADDDIPEWGDTTSKGEREPGQEG